MVYEFHLSPSFNPVVLLHVPLSPVPDCNTVSRRWLLGYVQRRPRAESDETCAWREKGGEGRGAFRHLTRC
ncbi:uncharacterized [Tachysurus ichikawai]